MMTSAEGYPCDVIDPVFLSCLTSSFTEHAFNIDDFLDIGDSSLHPAETGSVVEFDKANHGHDNTACSIPPKAELRSQGLPNIQIDAPRSAPQRLTKGRKRTKKQKEARKFQRQAIPTETKALLTTYLERDPYPSAATYEKLVTEHGLPLKTIKNWFSNARARKDPYGM
jgi:hypothetical protein